jgi:alanyl-tRNA synthetase
MSGAYPELIHQAPSIERVVRAEEDRFASTLRLAMSEFRKTVEKLPRDAAVLPGADAFRLYDTYGLALDFIEELAQDHDKIVDREGFEREMEAQRDRARQASKLGAVSGDPVYLDLLQKGRTQFLGYDNLEVEDARVLAVLKEGKLSRRLDKGDEGEIVLDRTPFYGESGGQVGDRGVIAAEGAAAAVHDTRLPLPGLHAHQVKVTAGSFEPGMTVRAEVDAQRRHGAMRHHTSTHLLHAALREFLGPHVKQTGSLVEPGRLRFDFSHYQQVNERELRHMENRVNEVILRDSPLQVQQMGREAAMAYGALAFFGDKYGESVRVVEVPGFSKEFCGGTHVHQTGQIGLFLVTNEQGISAGNRRVEAVTGAAALEVAQRDQGILEELEQAAKVDRHSLVDEYAKLKEQLKARERELQALKLKLATGGAGASAPTDLQQVGDAQVWTPRFEGLDRRQHATVVDDFRNRNRGKPFVVVSSALDGEGVHVIGAVSDSLKDRLTAPELFKRLGLRGGGRADFAQGGGVAPGDVEDFRRKALDVAREALSGGPGLSPGPM